MGQHHGTQQKHRRPSLSLHSSSHRPNFEELSKKFESYTAKDIEALYERFKKFEKKGGLDRDAFKMFVRDVVHDRRKTETNSLAYDHLAGAELELLVRCLHSNLKLDDDHVFSVIDIDKSENVDFDELLYISNRAKEPGPQGKLELIFLAMDYDKTGSLSESEVQRVKEGFNLDKSLDYPKVGMSMHEFVEQGSSVRAILVAMGLEEPVFPLQIFLKDGSKFLLEVGKNQSLAQLKFEIQKEKGIPSHKQSLHVGNRVLDDDVQTIRDLNLLEAPQVLLTILQ